VSSGYSLGSDDAEVARLDGQAVALGPPTHMLLHVAGVGPGMRVLDVGTGLGHVAFIAAEAVGPEGAVVGVDQDPRLLGVAESRRTSDAVTFVQGDARSFRDAAPFDAVVTRLLLFHLPGALEVVRHHRDALRPGGVMLAIDADNGTARAQPAVPLVASAHGWIDRAFLAAGADPYVGARLGPLLRDAGFEDVQTLGVQGILQPESGHGPAMLVGVLRSLAPTILEHGIATEAELGLDSLEERMQEQVAAADAVVLPPCLVGAWGRAPRDR
jgi:SAM-dependent methyltransferase